MQAARCNAHAASSGWQLWVAAVGASLHTCRNCMNADDEGAQRQRCWLYDGVPRVPKRRVQECVIDNLTPRFAALCL
jgi:hypothetical protein